MAATPVSLQHHFADLIDPRSERSCQHELLDIVGIALCAVISGAEAWTAIEAYGHAKRDWLAQFFRLPNGIPSHDTFRRVFCLLDPEAFHAASPTGSRPWRRAAWGTDGSSRSTARRYAGADAAGWG